MSYLQATLISAAMAVAATTATSAKETANCVKPTAMEMSADRFWSIVDATTGQKDQSSQRETLRAMLSKLPADDLAAFHVTFLTERDRGWTWELWGAAYVINGGASDDGFEYFLDWLVSRGRSAFEKALTNPDRLGDVIPSGARAELEFEALPSVAGEVWVAKTGKGWDTFGEVLQQAFDNAARCRPNTSNSSGPSGTPFKEEPEHLSKRYPKLWKRFGKTPLG